MKLADGVPVFIPYDCPVENFQGYYGDKTKLLILNNPNNPAGWVYREDDLKLICQECRKRGIYVLKVIRADHSSLRTSKMLK